MTEYAVIMTTTPSTELAEKIAETLLAARLAACIQVTNIDSYYTWKGEQVLDQEKLLLIKTKSSLFSKPQCKSSVPCLRS